jgi:hypothetical protein
LTTGNPPYSNRSYSSIQRGGQRPLPVFPDARRAALALDRVPPSESRTDADVFVDRHDQPPLTSKTDAIRRAKAPDHCVHQTGSSPNGEAAVTRRFVPIVRVWRRIRQACGTALASCHAAALSDSSADLCQPGCVDANRHRSPRTLSNTINTINNEVMIPERKLWAWW